MSPAQPGTLSRHGAVSAGHTATAEAAAEVLAEGGNAFDAAIAGLWMACVAEPVLASPAGGGFFMARRARRTQSAPGSTGSTGSAGGTELFDFFAQTPRRRRRGAEFRAVTVDFGPATQDFHIGAGAAAVPGFVPGLYAVHERLGQLPMTRLLAPAIAAARTGVRLTAFQAHVAGLVSPILLAESQTADHFAPQGAFPPPGTGVKNHALAETFEHLAREGLALFTHGPLAAAMCDPALMGHLSGADFANYKVERRPVLSVDYQGWRVALNPPPAAGGALVGLTLHLAASHAGAGDVPSIESLGRALAEVVAIRDHDPFNVATRICKDGLAPPSRPGEHRASQRGTTHISVIDGDGNAAAATVSNGEGNGHMIGGFLMNNMLGEDDINPGGVGNWQPDTRLSSMMAPTIMSRGRRVVALGSGGSNRIRSAVAIVAARIAQGRNLEVSVIGPRLHVEGAHLDFEDHFSAAERALLVAAFPDHRAWAEPDMFFGGVHAVARAQNGDISAVADPRRDGSAILVAPAPSKHETL